MECYSSGKKTVNLEEKDHCCAALALEFESVSAKCCGFDKVEKIFDGFSGQAAIELPTIFFSKVIREYSESVSSFYLEADRSFLKGPPLPLSGFQLLKVLSVFRI
jgi:hypothetical protein